MSKTQYKVFQCSIGYLGTNEYSAEVQDWILDREAAGFHVRNISTTAVSRNTDAYVVTAVTVQQGEPSAEQLRVEPF